MNYIAFPEISPFVFSIGGFGLRWYSLAYLLGIIFAWLMAQKIVKSPNFKLNKEMIDDYIVWGTVGIILGGRIGYILFYNLDFYLDDPIAMLQLWKGGMSFHGGLLGVIVSFWLFAKSREIEFFEIADVFALTAPIGLFFGRIANFINDELWGRVDYGFKYAVLFPKGGYVPRHPSQLYEAVLEGLLLFIILNLLWRLNWVKSKRAFISGIFLIGYSSFRMIIENYREPDYNLGFILGDSITMGQLLSLPMILLGIVICVWSYRKNNKNV